MSQTLAIAKFVAIVLRPADGLFVADAGQFGKSWIGFESRIKRPIAALFANWLSGVRKFLVNVHGFVFVQTQNVDVFDFENRIAIQSPAIAQVEFLSDWVAVMRIHQAADTATGERPRRRRDRRQRACTVWPLAKSEPGAGHGIGRAGETQHSLEDSRIGL